MNRIRTLLVDDEEPARDRLRMMLGEFEDVEIVGEACDAEAAIREISISRPDLIFLDIQMPGKSGMELVSSLQPPRPRIIFCTAFDQYALDAFEQNAQDYLLKPLNRTRLRKAVDRVRRSLQENEKFRQDVASASETQARLFPQNLPGMAHLDYCGICHPAEEVGGDYFDFLSIGENQLGIAVGDVSGKGLFAGLLMASLQARVQSLAPLHGESLGQFFSEINRSMYSSTASNRYATLFYALFDDTTRNMIYLNAGHTPPLLFRPAGKDSDYRTQKLSTHATPIGLLAGGEYRAERIQLAPGDILVMFSDGLTEARDPDGREFGTERLEPLVNRFGERNAEELRDRILVEVECFRKGAPAQDDMTVIVSKVS